MLLMLLMLLNHGFVGKPCKPNVTARPYGLPKVRMEFKYSPSTCSKTCAGPVFWHLRDDEP